MKQLKSHDFPKVYEALGVDLSTLGCVMLDVEAIKMGPLSKQEEKDLYYSEDKSRFWIDGLVCEKTAHCTLLYGLLEPAKNYAWHIDQVLEGWEMKTLEIESIDSFDSPYEDEDYYCIIAKIKVTPELLEGHQRLEFLPHIDTFAGYKPHISLAYVKKDDGVRDRWIKIFQDTIGQGTLKIQWPLNFGGNK